MHVPHGHKQAAVLCILTANDQYLLLERYREPNKGALTPVGGKMEAFETPLEAALRETAEETGLSIETASFCGILIDNSPTKYNWICFVYKSEIPFQQPGPCDEGKLVWIDRDGLDTAKLPHTDTYIYQYLDADTPFVFNAVYDEALVLQSLDEDLSGQRIYSLVD